jgi:hypothetical protein
MRNTETKHEKQASGATRLRLLTGYKFPEYVFSESDLNIFSDLTAEEVSKVEDEHHELLYASRASEGVIARQTPSGGVKAFPATIPQTVREFKGYDTEPNNIPKDFQARDAWACSFLDDKGRLNKRPMMTRETAASSTDAATWSSVATISTQGANALGFMLSDSDPYVVIDLDHPKKGDKRFHKSGSFDVAEYDKAVADFKTLTAKTLARFPSYVESSQSGQGVHIFIKGSLAAITSDARNKDSIKGVEIYERERYILMTGNRLVGAQAEPVAMQDELAAFYWETFPRLTQAASARVEYVPNGDEYQATEEEILEIIKKPCFFKTLATYNGQSTKGNTGSELDGEFCMYMSFFTRNPETIYDLWLQSPIAREKVIKKGKKWFLTQNIASALRTQKDSFKWQKLEPEDTSTLEEAKQYFHFKMEESKQEVEKAKADDSAFFEAVAKQDKGLPHGVMGALARHFLDGAIYPDEQFAIASALGVASSIASRGYYFDQGQAPNVYMIAMGGSGSGKDTITKDISRVLQATDKHTDTRFLGRMCRAVPASKEGVTTALADNGIGSVTFLKSEMDKYLAKANKNETSKQKEITDEILELYSQSNAEFVKYPPSKASKDNQAPPVHAPCVTLVGEGTKDVLFDNLSSDTLTGGFVSRLLLIERGSEERKVNQTLRTVKRLRNNIAFYDREGDAKEVAKIEKDLAQYKYVGDDGRAIIPDSVLSSLALLSRQVIKNCEYTTNYGTEDATLDVFGSVEGEKVHTVEPKPQWVIFHPLAVDYIDGEDDKINVKMLQDGNTRGAAWSRTVLKAKKVACLLAIMDNPVNPTVELRDMRWSFKWVCQQSKLLANAIDKGEVGGGEASKNLKALQGAIEKHIESAGGSLSSWTKENGKSLLSQNCISRAMINQVANTVYLFRNIKGAQKSSEVDNCVELLCVDGFLKPLDRDAGGKRVGVCYAFSPDLKK